MPWKRWGHDQAENRDAPNRHDRVVIPTIGERSHLVDDPERREESLSIQPSAQRFLVCIISQYSPEWPCRCRLVGTCLGFESLHQQHQAKAAGGVESDAVPQVVRQLSLIHISEPTRLGMISY